ncbi:Up-regulated during septation-domain-containing protein [Lasiosphaeria ovina]|uniref:Up-regulated during septation-domain-containing protein n=1 Tax=Lasiosphaeria ovina TaxID=92902 RepID=A0AAE0K8Y7_9PEZI|nr:Up-regulated during septation-domain-containing protein [Lasiosphaeria ovina]
MNGVNTRRGGDGFTQGSRLPPPAVQPPPSTRPSAKALVEGYRKDILIGFDQERPRYNPLNAERPQSSALVDLKDPIQVHLLTETALLDSKKFEILSQEEVDDLKKQIQSLTMRVEQARTNLAIQSKYRDAAISMARLYSPAKSEGKRRSLLGNRMSDSVKEAEMEKQASERRCEELATELFTLEKRLVEPQRRLLQHTAGILQMTHRAAAKKFGQPAAGQPMMNGIPGSPESLYTYSNARNSLEATSEDADFDDRSLYLPLDQMNGQPGRPRKNTIEIPTKSPIREQQNQLREEMDRAKDEISRLQAVERQLKEENSKLKKAEEESTTGKSQSGALEKKFKDENTRLKEAEQQLKSEADELRAQTRDQRSSISNAEQKLEVMNNKLREVVVTFSPAKNNDFGYPEVAVGSGSTLKSQLEYLERGIATAMEEQRLHATKTSRESEEVSAAAAAAAASLAKAESRIKALSRQTQDVLQKAKITQPPAESEATLDGQLNYIEKALGVFQTELASSGKKNIAQVDAVLMGLWDIIQTGYSEIQQQRIERKKLRSEKGVVDDDDDDVSGDEIGDMNEKYSLQAFSTKVQWLYAQATSLREQKSVLKRQIKQQRELNNKSGSEKDEDMRAMEDELETTRAMLDESERTAQDAMDRLGLTLRNMETLQKTNAANESASFSSSKTIQDQLKDRNTKIAALESSNQNVQAKLADAETNLASLKAQLSQASESQTAAQAEAGKLAKAVKDKDEELDRLNMMVIELKTEVAFAKAELDGAYGSRKQRAAEVAALSKTSETSELNTQVQNLRSELENTLKDLEDITKESIAAEKEKLDLESKLDDALSSKASLESEIKTLRDKLDAEVSRLQEQLDAERLKAPTSSAGGGAGGAGSSRAGASMLSEQFRATMKEERKKFQEELREEQARRRKIEDELRALRKSQGLSRSTTNLGSSLSPR